ncbi:metal-dependent hydrolase [Candidatus Pacearchaeota archaeon]|nr:metal-dependent hydrolase [Candidatus Pacearchaeota archaeon]
MSGFQKHNYYGIIGSVAIALFLIMIGIKFEFALMLSLVVYLGANFPDLDTASTPSIIAARFAIVASIYFVSIEKPIYAVIACMVFIAPKISKHRGWTHKYSTPILIPVITYFTFEVYTLIAIAFSAGLLIHYAIDRLNPFNTKNLI